MKFIKKILFMFSNKKEKKITKENSCNINQLKNEKLNLISVGGIEKNVFVTKYKNYVIFENGLKIEVPNDALFEIYGNNNDLTIIHNNEFIHISLNNFFNRSKIKIEDITFSKIDIKTLKLHDEELIGCYFDFTEDNFKKLKNRGYECLDDSLEMLEAQGFNKFLAIEKEFNDIIGTNENYDFSKYNFVIWSKYLNGFVKSAKF